MYEKFYNFRENPFTITPDSKFFFPSQRHARALDGLFYTIVERRGFAVITGEIGSGKTTICRTLLGRLDASAKVVMITNTYLTPKELLSCILEDLGVTSAAKTKSSLLNSLKKFLLEQLSLGVNVVLIIDEAQNLSLRMLEEIRMLSNLETEKKKMIQIILSGQPNLKDKLQMPELAQFRQRVCVQYHIQPLDMMDTDKYIRHRLRKASINEDVNVEFTLEAIAEIYNYSQGVPRVINMICNSVLLVSYVLEAKQITLELLREAMEEFKAEEKIEGAPEAAEPVREWLSEEVKSVQGRF